MLKSTKSLVIAGIISLVSAGNAIARVQPFILGSSEAGDMAAAVTATKSKLTEAGFEIAGSYSPYGNTEIIVFTNDELKSTATKSERGGYGAAMRASVTNNSGKIEVSYTNPKYWANAYRLSSSLDGVSSKLKSALGSQQEFSSGDKKLTTGDMRGYHYTFAMPYFDDPSDLAEHSNHAAAVKAVEANLASGSGATSKVYSISMGKDTEGNEMTLIGVGLKGSNAKDCSADKFIMDIIDKETPRASAHLPYEVLVYGNSVEALSAKFRIALSWPHLPMMASETGATFMNIMCAPDSISDALTKAAGGSEDDSDM
jgi:hypothetical protein